MKLHAMVSGFLSRNRASLGRVQEALGLAVPEALNKWEVQHPEGFDLHGAVLAATLREVFHCSADLGEAATLELTSGPNRSIRLADRVTLEVARVRRWPSHPKAKRRLSSVEVPQALFGDSGIPMGLHGPDIDALGLNLMLAVLWDVDFRSRSLALASLALVQDIDAPHRTIVYSATPLPMPVELRSPVADLPPPGDFHEFFDGQADTGSTSA